MTSSRPRSCCADDCCESPPAPPPAMSPDDVREAVREGYSEIARTGASCCSGGAGSGGGGCCGVSTLTPGDIARSAGYSETDLEGVPEDANMGLSCGNPTALASLRPGEVVLDLGAGGGFDCFVAGPKVGARGRVIGVDMTADMLARARSGLAAYRARSGMDNVEFRLGEIEHLPVADASVDVVISNCVLNLSPDKPAVWREIARVLRPGGRVAISDLALLRPLPVGVVSMVEALIGCVSGAVLVSETRAMAEAAGLIDVTLTPKPVYIESMVDCRDPLYRKIVEHLPPGTRPGEFITSLDVSGRKAR